MDQHDGLRHQFRSDRMIDASCRLPLAFLVANGLTEGSSGFPSLILQWRVGHRNGTIPFVETIDENFDVGVDTRTGVEDKDYQPPYRFTGKIDKLTVKLVPLRTKSRCSKRPKKRKTRPCKSLRLCCRVLGCLALNWKLLANVPQWVKMRNTR
jgi:hypothetical protein